MLSPRFGCVPKTTDFRTLSEVYDLSARLGRELANTYAMRIVEEFRTQCTKDGRYGALVLGRLLLGGGDEVYRSALPTRTD